MNEKYHPPTACPICHREDIPPILKIKNMPVWINQLWPDRQSATTVPRKDLELRYCRYCQHIFNQAYDSSLLANFSRRDIDQSYFSSPTYQYYTSILVRSLVERYQLHDKRIVSIGPNTGNFLTMLCQYSGANGVSFDPYMPVDSRQNGNELTIIRDIYSEKYVKEYCADFVSCRHYLEELEHPDQFVQSLRYTLTNNQDAVVFFEVPNMMHTINSLGIGEIIYAHYSYFSPQSLGHVFRQNGFSLLEISESFGGRFLTIEAHPNGHQEGWSCKSPGYQYDMETEVAHFARKLEYKISAWRQHLEQFSDMGKRVVIWGADTKSVAFLNLMRGREETIEWIVDSNRHLQGQFVAGTGHQIIEPESIEMDPPDVIILLDTDLLAGVSTLLFQKKIEADIIVA